MCNGKFILNSEMVRIWTDPKGNGRDGPDELRKVRRKNGNWEGHRKTDNIPKLFQAVYYFYLYM